MTRRKAKKLGIKVERTFKPRKHKQSASNTGRHTTARKSRDTPKRNAVREALYKRHSH